MSQGVIVGDSAHELKKLKAESVDLIVTDPPYGYSFMGKDWDRAVPPVELWRECLRVLKPGGFAFVMSAPRSDVQAQMIGRLTEAGFRMDFTPIYWTYASGFPKAGNIGKLVDKRNGKPQRSIELEEYLAKAILDVYGNHHKLAEEMGVAESLIRHWTGKCGDQYLIPPLAQYETLKRKLGLDTRFDELIAWEEARREVVGTYKSDAGGLGGIRHGKKGGNVTISATDAAKAFDGSYAGFQPKPAVEVILVAMKPLSEKTFVDQALANGKGITWLDDVRVPGAWERSTTTRDDIRGGNAVKGQVRHIECEPQQAHTSGRFPANLLVGDDILGEHSRFFDLDAWANKHHPFITVPKASASEKDTGLRDQEPQKKWGKGGTGADTGARASVTARNFHPTVKPLKLMSYLVTLGSRPGDVILDPFLGSGTTAVAAKLLDREWIGIELSREYAVIAANRIAAAKNIQAKLAI